MQRSGIQVLAPGFHRNRALVRAPKPGFRFASSGLRKDKPLDVAQYEGGDPKDGKKMYKADCKTCHGRKGQGKERKESPPLRGQYGAYLMRSIQAFLAKERMHADDEEDESFVDYSEQELKDIVAFITTLDDEQEKKGK